MGHLPVRTGHLKTFTLDGRPVRLTTSRMAVVENGHEVVVAGVPSDGLLEASLVYNKSNGMWAGQRYHLRLLGATTIITLTWGLLLLGLGRRWLDGAPLISNDFTVFTMALFLIGAVAAYHSCQAEPLHRAVDKIRHRYLDSTDER